MYNLSWLYTAQRDDLSSSDWLQQVAAIKQKEGAAIQTVFLLGAV
jgi:hypothetical protein